MKAKKIFLEIHYEANTKVKFEISDKDNKHIDAIADELEKVVQKERPQ